MLGKHHSEATKLALSWSTRAMMESLTPDQLADRTMKGLRTRVANRHHVRQRMETTWKAGWRHISGKDIYFRSRWEYNYAVYLQFLVEHGSIKSWDHEPKTFWFEGIKRGRVSYLPDFLIVNMDGSEEYHEVKGWMDPGSRTKLRRMKKYHPTVKLRVIDGKWFKANSPKLSFLKGWEHDARLARGL